MSAADPAHRWQCATLDQARLRATCEHGDNVDITPLGSPVMYRLCSQCGAVAEVPR